MQLAARIYASFRVAGRGVFLMFEFASDTAKLRVGDKIQLRRPTGESTDAIVKGIEHVEPKKRVLPYNVALALKPPFHDELFEEDTEIWVADKGESDSKTG